MIEQVFDVLPQSGHDRSQGVGVGPELEIQSAPEEPVASIGAEELEGTGGIPGDVPPQRGASIGTVGLLDADGVGLDLVFVSQLEGVLHDRIELHASRIGTVDAGRKLRIDQVEPAAVGGKILHGFELGLPGEREVQRAIEGDGAVDRVVQGNSEIPLGTRDGRVAPAPRDQEASGEEEEEERT